MVFADVMFFGVPSLWEVSFLGGGPMQKLCVRMGMVCKIKKIVCRHLS